MDKYVDKAGLQDFATKMNAKQKTIFALKSEVGSPLVAATAADMTDTDKVYVYTGSEAGYTAGNWYYYDGSVWQSGGVYNAVAFTTDTTLSNPGEAADAKVTGDDIRALQSDMANKANKDGSYDTMNVGTAENLTPYSADAGVEQDIAFNMQGAGCGNGETQVDTGSYCQLKEKRGHSVAVNQKVPNADFSDGMNDWQTSDLASYSASGGICTFTASASGGRIVNGNIGGVLDGHKYLGLAEIKLTTATTSVNIELRGGSLITGAGTQATTAWQTLVSIFSPTAYGSAYIRVIDYRASGWDAIEVKSFYLIDLTQWFGSNDNIPAYLLSHPEDFGRYYKGSLALNAGTLVNADGGVLKTIGRNQWNEQWKNGYFDADTGAFYESGANNLAPADYIAVIPNTQYAIYQPTASQPQIYCYDINKAFLGRITGISTGAGTFTTPSNCGFIKFCVFTYTPGSYNNDVTISLYYEGESGYSEHYAYEELASINTGSETLRSAGSAYDSKTPDGTITRRIGVVNLGTLNWIRATSYTNPLFYVVSISGRKNATPILCDKYASIGTSGMADFGNYAPNNSCAYHPIDGIIFIRDDAYTDAATFKAAMDGVYLYYELATPTTESGTSYAETVTIDDFGSMQFANTNGVPQGNLIFYPVDYKAFLDTAYNELDGDATQIAQKGNLASGDPETIKGVVDYINAKIPAPPASDGAYKLTVTVSSGVATYSWEA